MYLTKFPLNLTRRETRAMLASPYRLHAAIAGCFPDTASVSNNGRVLWRVDRTDQGALNLFIVSPTTPSLVGLDEQIGWPDLAPQWLTRPYEPFLESIDIGQRYGFRLVANPVVSRKGLRNEGGASKRVAHLTPMQQASWLVGASAYEGQNVEPPDFIKLEGQSRAERNGFEVVRDNKGDYLKLLVSDSRKISFVQGKKGRRLTLATARFDGVLEVRDPDLLRHALCYGIGHGKGFGCGLMTLARIGRL